MIHIKRSKNKQWFVKIVAKNGECLYHSENLKTKQSAIKNIKSLMRIMRCPSMFVEVEGTKHLIEVSI